MTSNEPTSVLVVLATGKMGRGLVEAFSATNKYHVFGTTRTPQPTNNKDNVTMIVFDWINVEESMERALKVSNASVAVLMTSLVIAKTTEQEVLHGMQMIDACKEAGTRHVILCSNVHAGVAPKYNQCIQPKAEMEKYIRGAGLASYSILGTTSFFENFDDPTIMNPLKRGKLVDIYPPDCKISHVACLDIGKAAVRWNGRRLDTVSSVKALAGSEGIHIHWIVWTILEALTAKLNRMTVKRIYSKDYETIYKYC